VNSKAFIVSLFSFYMEKQALQPSLKELQGVLNDMKALLEWHKLKQFEAQQGPTSALRFHDTTWADLNNRYFSFLSLALQIHAAIAKKTADGNRFNNIKKQLTKIELQAYFLGSGIRFY
jgi:hypothetical protein